MKFPYGICDFQDIMKNHYFYVDRTAQIPLIEDEGKHVLFLRPRRFGKSLLLSMLENYYDVAKAEQFETLFGSLAIGKNPTPLHNQYLVMKWDFSLVQPQGDATQIEHALYAHVNNQIEKFAEYYKDLLPNKQIRIDETNAISSFERALIAVQQTPYKLYLLIDEYDNFANEVMMSRRDMNQNRYEALLYGEGVVKTLFKAVKAMSSGLGLDRAFITGVSPVVLHDMTSGYNIAVSIYLESEFNDLCGFQEAEIAAALHQITSDCQLPTTKADEALEVMRVFYDGYCFSYDVEAFVYNPTLALYFLKYFQKRCQSPQNLLDSNLSMDRAKIAYVSLLPGGAEVILAALTQEQPLLIYNLAMNFGLNEMLYANKDRTFMASLLYFMGVLTISGKGTLGKLWLTIPNVVVRKLYVERLQEMLLPHLQKEEALPIAERFYTTGDLQPVCDLLERYFSALDNRDSKWANEMTIKAAFLPLLFNDQLYHTRSEMVLERKYADLTMIVRPDMRGYPLLDFLIEFKHLHLNKLGLTGEQVKQKRFDELKTLAPVQDKLAEAKTQLEGYRQQLQATYPELQLHAYSIVALGFERFVWVEV